MPKPKQENGILKAFEIYMNNVEDSGKEETLKKIVLLHAREYKEDEKQKYNLILLEALGDKDFNTWVMDNKKELDKREPNFKNLFEQHMTRAFSGPLRKFESVREQHILKETRSGQPTATDEKVLTKVKAPMPKMEKDYKDSSKLIHQVKNDFLKKLKNFTDKNLLPNAEQLNTMLNEGSSKLGISQEEYKKQLLSGTFSRMKNIIKLIDEDWTKPEKDVGHKPRRPGM